METTPINVLLMMYKINEISFVTGSCPLERTNSPGGKVAMCYATTLHQFSDSETSFKCDHCKCIKKERSETIVDCDASPKVTIITGREIMG